MPYTLSTKKVKGKKKWCMTSKDTGKTYCYGSASERAKGMKMHEMFKNMPKSKIRIAKKSAKRQTSKKVKKQVASAMKLRKRG